MLEVGGNDVESTSDQQGTTFEVDDYEEDQPIKQSFAPYRTSSSSRSKRQRASSDLNAGGFVSLPAISASDESEFDVFARHLAMQMKQLPLADALELVAEIQNAVVQKRLKVRMIHSKI